MESLRRLLGGAPVEKATREAPLSPAALTSEQSACRRERESAAARRSRNVSRRVAC